MQALSKLAWLAAIGAALALTGCVTVENTLTQNDIGNMKLTGVTVAFTPDARMQWDDGEQACSAANPQAPPARGRPEMRNCVQAMLVPKIKAGVEQAMAGQLIGSRPVRLDLVVRRFWIPSLAWNILVGYDNAQLIAAATLVDARTGAVIIAHPELNAFVPPANGVIGVAVQAAVNSAMRQTLEERLVTQYGKMYRDWLTHGA
jgi:hypothetical protein